MNVHAQVLPYDVEAIRREFPILASQVYGKPLVYLDNAASAQKPRAVIDAMVRTMETGYANVHRGLHHMANVATEAYEGAREDVRRFLDAALDRRDRLHALGHRGHQSRRRQLWAHGDRGGGRDHPLHHGAPFQHRARGTSIASARAP